MAYSRRTFIKASTVGLAGLWPMGTTAEMFLWSQQETAIRFLAAASDGDLTVVTRLLATAPELLAARNRTGLTAYALAHLNGHAEVGRYLRTQGYTADLHEAALAQDWERFDALAATHPPEVNANHPIGGTAMYAAAAGGAGPDMWRVYAVDAEPNIVPDGRTVSGVQAALGYRDLATAEVTAGALLSNSADPNAAPGAEESPLHVAARRGSTVMVELLVRLGARVDVRDRQGRTALEVAERAGQSDVVSLLAGHAAIPRTHSSSRTAYDVQGRPYRPADVAGISVKSRGEFVGQSHGNLAFVTDAVRTEPRLVHSVATTGEICVEACAHMGRKPIVEFLLERGAPYSLPTAVMRDDLSRVTQLLDEDPKRIQERGAHDFALLWYPVIGQCRLEMMQLLLARGAEVEQQHFLGTTALHWACQRGPIEMVELLINHGADVNRVGRKFGAAGETPLQMARRGADSRIAQLLIARGART
jgi:ankyrin repeat protein